MSRQKGSKHYKSDHTQTSQNTTILYYHESKKTSFDEAIPQDDEDNDAIETPADEEQFLQRKDFKEALYNIFMRKLRTLIT